MDAASARIMEKLVHGALSAADPLMLWNSPGTGLLCDGCGVGITRSEQEQKIEMASGRTLRFHVTCHRLWRTLKDTRPKA